MRRRAALPARITQWAAVAVWRRLRSLRAAGKVYEVPANPDPRVWCLHVPTLAEWVAEERTPTGFPLTGPLPIEVRLSIWR